MKFPGRARRRRAILLTLAQLALVAYLFQVAAIDHWSGRSDIEIYGIPGTDSHVAHCHGDAANCADVPIFTATNRAGEVVSLPPPPARFFAALSQAPAFASDVFVPTPAKPPRGA